MLRNKSPKTAQKTTSFEHKRSLGQNFLTTAVVPNWMCEAGEVREGDIVLEIGPGIGALTKVLLEKGAIVHAIEVDPRAIETLKETFTEDIKDQRLWLYHEDIKDLDLAKIGLKNQAFKVVANIPYYLSGLILRLLLEGRVEPKTIVLLMQKEVVARIARDPKTSILSLSVKAFGTAKYIKTVSRGHFKPAPKVDSAILQITDISKGNFLDFSPEFFFEIVHLGLGKKRKQLFGNLKAKYPKEDLEQIFADLNIKPTERGEDLPLATWLKLVSAVRKLEMT